MTLKSLLYYQVNKYCTPQQKGVSDQQFGISLVIFIHRDSLFPVLHWFMSGHLVSRDESAVPWLSAAPFWGAPTPPLSSADGSDPSMVLFAGCYLL